jgi:hypothetical protein
MNPVYDEGGERYTFNHGGTARIEPRQAPPRFGPVAPPHLRSPYVRPRLETSRLPFIFPLTFISAIATLFFSASLFGKNLTGYGWVFIFIASLARLFRRWKSVRGISAIWAPWSVFVIAYAFSGFDFAWQEALQILCPIFAAAAVSTYRLSPSILDKLDKTIRISFWFYCAGFFLIVLPFVLRDIDNSSFANGAITALFFQSYFLCRFFMVRRDRAGLLYYLTAVLLPCLSVNRGPMAASLVLAIFTFAPVTLMRRALILLITTALLLVAFQSAKVQHKMFVTGHGTLSDMLSGDNVESNGRTAMWKSLTSGFEERPWFGHGGNGAFTWLASHGFPKGQLAHNDWLRIRFDYGWTGEFLFMVTLLVQLLSLWKRTQHGDPHIRATIAAGLGCLAPFIVIMYTDNILVYCQFFTVPMMLLIALGYAIPEDSRKFARRYIASPITARLGAPARAI